MLGGQLFIRNQLGVTPTPLGEIVLTRARAILPTIEELMQETNRASATDPERRRFRVGTINGPLLGGVIGAIRSLYPDSDITTRAEGSPLPLTDHLAVGRLEAAVVGNCPGYELPPRPGVAFHPVVTEPVFVMLPARHRLAREAQVDLADLHDEDWVLPRPDDDRVREYWTTTAGFQMRAPYEAEGRVIVDIIRGGWAVSLCQPTFVASPGIAILPIAGAPLWYQHVLAWRQDGPLAAHADSLVSAASRAYENAAACSEVYVAWRAAQRDSVYGGAIGG
jgi:DNA-binding transcriptional LysR family regulator